MVNKGVLLHPPGYPSSNWLKSRLFWKPAFLLLKGELPSACREGRVLSATIKTTPMGGHEQFENLLQNGFPS